MAGKPSLFKEIRAAGGIRARICPATSNLPTRMAQDSWSALCKATYKKQTEQQRASNGYNGKVADVSQKLNFCRECKGKILPPGLELIPMEDMMVTKLRMVTKLSKGVCSACHQRGMVSKAFSAFDPMCNTCAPAFTAVNTRPEVVAQAIIGFGVVDKMLQLLAPAIDQQQLLALVGDNLPESVEVQCESATLKKIAEVIGYDGESSYWLVQAVRNVVSAERSALKALKSYKERCISAEQGAHSDALQRIIAALGCECEDHDDSVACVLDAIKVLTQTLVRYQESCDAADELDRLVRDAVQAPLDASTVEAKKWTMEKFTEMHAQYDHVYCEKVQLQETVSSLATENARLSSLVEDQADALAMALSGDNLPCETISSYTMTPEREALADFGLRVLAGRVRLEVV